MRTGAQVRSNDTVMLTAFSPYVYSASGASVVAIDNKIEQAMVSKIQVVISERISGSSLSISVQLRCVLVRLQHPFGWVRLRPSSEREVFLSQTRKPGLLFLLAQ